MFTSSSQTRNSLNQPLIREEDEESTMRGGSTVVIPGKVVRVESFPAPPPTSVYAHKVEGSQNGYQIDSDDASIKRRQRRRAIVIGGFIVVLFLLLFFLIPRAPRMSYEVINMYVYVNIHIE